MLPPDAIPNQLLYGLFSPRVNAPFAVVVGVRISLKLSFRARRMRLRPAQLCPTDYGANGLDYEIYMLRYTALKLAERKPIERDACVYLEAFLVHYRNLIEFLGKENPRNTNLHVTNIWRLENLDEPLNMKVCINKANNCGGSVSRKKAPEFLNTSIIVLRGESSLKIGQCLG